MFFCLDEIHNLSPMNLWRFEWFACSLQSLIKCYTQEKYSLSTWGESSFMLDLVTFPNNRFFEKSFFWGTNELIFSLVIQTNQIFTSTVLFEQVMSTCLRPSTSRVCWMIEEFLMFKIVITHGKYFELNYFKSERI